MKALSAPRPALESYQESPSSVIDTFLCGIDGSRGLKHESLPPHQKAGSQGSKEADPSSATTSTSYAATKPRRLQRGTSRAGSGRKTSHRVFDLGGGSASNIFADAAASSQGEGLGATVQPSKPAPSAPKEDTPAGVKVEIKVLKKCPAETLPSSPIQSYTPAQPTAPPVTPAVPATLLKSQGCWYLHPSPVAPSPAAELSAQTPSSMTGAPGCWYVHMGGHQQSPPPARSPSVPQSQLRAKGCWYLHGGFDSVTPTPAGKRRRRSSLPPRPPSSVLKTKGAWYLEGDQATGSRGAAQDSRLLDSAIKSTGKTRTVTFGPPPQSTQGVGVETSGSRPRGVLTDLRNAYVHSVPTSARARAGQWRVEFGEGLSPYSFSPIPMRLTSQSDGASAVSEQASQDMDLETSAETQVASLAAMEAEAADATSCPPASAKQASAWGSSQSDRTLGSEEQHLPPSVEEEDAAPAATAFSPLAEVSAEQQAQLKNRRSSIAYQHLMAVTKEARTPGLIGAGTKTVGGVRRSTRQRYQPLEFWRNEYKEYCREHASMPTVSAVQTRTPNSAWPGTRKRSTAKTKRSKK